MTGISKALWPPHHDVACATGKMSFSITAVSERYADPLYVYAAYPMKIATSCSGSDSTRTTARRFHDDSTPGAWTSDEESISTSERYSTPLSTSCLKTLATSSGNANSALSTTTKTITPFPTPCPLQLPSLRRAPSPPPHLLCPSSLPSPHVQPRPVIAFTSPAPVVPAVPAPPTLSIVASPSSASAPPVAIAIAIAPPALPVAIAPVSFTAVSHPVPSVAASAQAPALPRPPSLLLPLSFQSRPPSYPQHRQPPRC
ncbi:hypothetical protein F5148DRAFT_601229 [Russula earlei]|uniref:Uncharacterized protein n=1 Tax=Russula earlei TaxID=71964 RepID=A0ACC0TUZ8_9AGAM|nr:hypothetical protein F5148DRAFT_601229 [Russula earlei]